MFYVYILLFIISLSALIYALKRLLEQYEKEERNEYGYSYSLSDDEEDDILIKKQSKDSEIEQAIEKDEEDDDEEDFDEDDEEDDDDEEESKDDEEQGIITEEVKETIPEVVKPVAATEQPAVSLEKTLPVENTEFAKDVSKNMNDIFSRLSVLESSLHKNIAGQKFTVNYLEKLLVEFDSLDKNELKNKIEQLRSDLTETDTEQTK